MSELPKGWAATTLDVITAHKSGNGKLIKGQQSAVPGDGLFAGFSASGQDVWLDHYEHEGDAIVVSAVGARCGKAFRASGKWSAVANTHIVWPHDVIDRDFLFLHLNNENFWVKGGSAQPFVKTGATFEQQFMLPPRNEQRRIVEKLDAVFEKSRAAKARLERLPALLDQLKRSILAAAFRGDLTKDWRAANPDVEPASVLLERIRAERRRKWEEALRAKGKDPKKATYEEPAAVDTSELPELPEGWAWASVESVSTLVTDGDHNPPKRVESGIPHLTAKNIKDWKLRFDGCSFVNEEGFAQTSSRYLPLAGDVIVTCVGTLGETAIVPEGVRFSADRNLAAIRPSNGILSRFLMMALNEPMTASNLYAGSGSSAQPHLYLSDLRGAPLAVTSSKEQEALLEILGDAWVAVAALRSKVEESIRGQVALEQAALAKAFRGELVPQDPTDEPADVLLERLRTARAAEPVARRPRTTRPAAASTTPTTTALAGEPVDLIIAVLRAARRQSTSAIADATGLDAADVRSVLKSLERLGKVSVEGKARGTMYVWQGDPA